MTNYDAITDLADLKVPAGTVLTPTLRWTDEQHAEYKAYQAARKRLSNQSIKQTPLEWLFSVVMLIAVISGGLFIAGNLVAGGAGSLTSPRPTIESY